MSCVHITTNGLTVSQQVGNYIYIYIDMYICLYVYVYNVMLYSGCAGLFVCAMGVCSAGRGVPIWVTKQPTRVPLPMALATNG